MNEILELVEFVNKKYIDFHKQYSINFNNKFNLAKLRVCDLINNVDLYNDFFDLITKYVVLLDKDKNNFEFNCSNVFNRIKNSNSIRTKIDRYFYKNKENGKVILNKCLNDLFGFRIIVNNLDLDIVFIKLVDIFKINSKIKIIKRELEGGYRAIHLYFKIDNFFFQWELQIWSEKERIINDVAHNIKYGK